MIDLTESEDGKQSTLRLPIGISSDLRLVEAHFQERVAVRPLLQGGTETGVFLACLLLGGLTSIEVPLMLH